MKATMITRRRFIRNGILAAASLSAQKSTAWAYAENTDPLVSPVLLVYNIAAKDGVADSLAGGQQIGFVPGKMTIATAPHD
jgi:hypothetical protein